MTNEEVVRIRLGHSLEELVEGPLPFCPKLLNITGHHRSHRYSLNTLSTFVNEMDSGLSFLWLIPHSKMSCTLIYYQALRIFSELIS